MKKSIFVLIAFIAIVAISCGRSNTKKTEVTTDTTTVAKTTMSADTTATAVDTTKVQ